MRTIQLIPIGVIGLIFGDNSSVHNCYGLEQRHCITDGYRTDKIIKPTKTVV